MTFINMIAVRTQGGHPLVCCKHCGEVDGLMIDNKLGQIRCKACGRMSEINPKPPKIKSPKKKKR